MKRQFQPWNTSEIGGSRTCRDAAAPLAVPQDNVVTFVCCLTVACPKAWKGWNFTSLCPARSSHRWKCRKSGPVWNCAPAAKGQVVDQHLAAGQFFQIARGCKYTEEMCSKRAPPLINSFIQQLHPRCMSSSQAVSQNRLYKGHEKTDRKKWTPEGAIIQNWSLSIQS